jgi:hypothetical protein
VTLEPLAWLPTFDEGAGDDVDQIAGTDRAARVEAPGHATRDEQHYSTTRIRGALYGSGRATSASRHAPLACDRAWPLLFDARHGVCSWRVSGRSAELWGRFLTHGDEYCIQYRMVHLNITLDEELYERLKAKAPPKKLSAFIADALRARLGPDEEELARAYRDAAKEHWRRSLADEWAATETEAWPE